MSPAREILRRTRRLTSTLALLFLGAALSTAGCSSVFNTREDCMVSVTVHGAASKPSREEIAAVERRAAPLLAEQGYNLTHDSRAEMMAQIDFYPDASPGGGEVVIRGIVPNPMKRATIRIRPPSDDPFPRQSSLQQISENEAKNLGR